MPQSLSIIIVHVVFSTKDRAPVLVGDVRPKLHAYMAACVRALGCECTRVGGTEDHVHLGIRLSRTLSVAALVQDVKRLSTKWVKKQTTALAAFAWQRGYGAFSTGPDRESALVRYIDNQEEHHRELSFKDEFERLLAANGIEFDERYVWD